MYLNIPEYDYLPNNQIFSLSPTSFTSFCTHNVLLHIQLLDPIRKKFETDVQLQKLREDAYPEGEST